MDKSVNVFNQFQEWDQKDKLHRLVNKGVLTPAQFRFYKIYADLSSEMNSRFKTKSMAVCNVCERHGVSHMMVYRAINFMEQNL